ncbi:MAG: hypothetical protein ACI8RZ_000696 [Myxococcota bacterium]|jgi:hypothetical protein
MPPTPLSEQQVWLAKFTGGAALSLEDSSQLSLDDQLEVRQQIERRRELILRETYIQRAHVEAETLHKELEVFKTAKIATTSGKMDMIGKGGDQTQGFGYEEDIGRVKRTPKEMQAMINAKGKVIAIEKGLKAVMVKRSMIDKAKSCLVEVDAPLFENRDIENELYTPLVRGLVFPEDQVGGEYSATQRMIDGSNQYYIDELVSRSEDSGASAEEWGSVLKSVTTAVKDLSVATVGLVTSVEMSGASAEAANQLLKTQKLINLGLMVGEAVVNTSIDVGVAISKADAASGISVVLSGLSGAVGGLVKNYTGDASLAKYIQIGMKGGSRLPLLVDAFLGDDSAEVKAGKFVDQLGGLFGDAFDITAVATNDKDDPNNTNNQKEIALFKAGVTTAYSGVAAALKGGIISKIEKRDWKGVAQVCVSVSSTVVQGALAGAAAQEALDKKAAIGADADGATKQAVLDKYGIDDQHDDFQDLYDAAILSEKTAVSTAFAKAASQQTESFGKLGDGISGLIAHGEEDGEDPIAEKIKEREAAEKEERDKLNRTAMEEATKRLEDDEKAFNKTLDLMGNDEFTETDLKSIGKLIAQMQRDRMIMQTASAIGGAGFAVASQFFAPMAIAGTLIKFLEALTAAVNRAIELRNWADASENALNAVSPYLTAIQNFVKNQKEQFSHYTIKCALIAVQVAGQVMQIAGAGTYAQAAGLVVEKGAKLAETIEDLTYKFYKEATLIAAWKVTKPALKNPNNRKANLIARRMNTTLAKYTLAFGAVIDKDPVALQAFKIIGLSPETLAAKDAKVDMVKNYLETRYDDDIQVYKNFTVDSKESWLNSAPAPALTTDCFLTLHVLAVSKGGVSDTKPNAITKSFRDMEAQKQRYAVALEQINSEPDSLDSNKAVFDDYESAIGTVSSLLKGFSPKLRNGSETSDDLQSALTELAELADAEIGILGMKRSEVFGRKEQLPPIPAPSPDKLKEELDKAQKASDSDVDLVDVDESDESDESDEL